MRKKYAGGHANHERWLVSYADFITLLFAFFVVMFASSQTDKTKAKAVSESVREALVSGGIAVGATTDIRIAFGVLQAALRHPVWIAKVVRTLAAEAGDRVLLGLGAGGDGPSEWEMVGIPRNQRGARLTEMLPPLLAMLNGEAVSHHGKFYDFDVPPLLPTPTAHIPVWIGARTEPTIRRALAVDGWMSVYASPERFGRAAAMLRDEATRLGRPPVALTAGIFASVVGSDAEAQERGVRHMVRTYGVSEETGARAIVGGMGRLREVLDQYIEAGATGIRLVFADPAEDAWPLVAKAFVG